MRHRAVASFGMLLATAVMVVTTHPVAGQAPAQPAPAKKWTVPRTADGHPDLQGFWTNSTYVPLERPNNVTKTMHTDEEFAQVIKEAAAREAEQTEPGTVADVHYDFSQFGLDRSQSAFVKTLRTSLIVDPPNGKMPPLTAEGQKRAADRAAERRRLGATTDAVQNMPIGTRCLIMAGSGPPMMSAGYNNNYQIVQIPGYVVIVVEMIHDARIIPLDGSPPCRKTSGCGWEIRVVIGSATRWSSTPLTFGPTVPIEIPIPKACISSNVSHVSMRTRFSTNSGSTIRQRLRNPGRQRFQ